MAVFLSAAGNPVVFATDKQKSFASPEDAAKELLAAVKSEDAKAMLAVLGPDAPGGDYEYVAQGKMIDGFALVAYPASYGNSGVMTFLVNHDGVVYDKDLRPETAELAWKITRFNPDKSWRRP